MDFKVHPRCPQSATSGSCSADPRPGAKTLSIDNHDTIHDRHGSKHARLHDLLPRAGKRSPAGRNDDRDRAGERAQASASTDRHAGLSDARRPVHDVPG
jgi:hypothetical protein